MVLRGVYIGRGRGSLTGDGWDDGAVFEFLWNVSTKLAYFGGVVAGAAMGVVVFCREGEGEGG